MTLYKKWKCYIRNLLYPVSVKPGMGCGNVISGNRYIRFALNTVCCVNVEGDSSAL